MLNLVIQYFRFNCSVSDLKVYLFENVQFSTCVENCLLELVDSGVDFLLGLEKSVDAVFIVNELMLNRLN